MDGRGGIYASEAHTFKTLTDLSIKSCGAAGDEAIYEDLQNRGSVQHGAIRALYIESKSFII
jgi:hypothetical protein